LQLNYINNFLILYFKFIIILGVRDQSEFFLNIHQWCFCKKIIFIFYGFLFYEYIRL
jgi:hypothetical protein